MAQTILIVCLVLNTLVAVLFVYTAFGPSEKPEEEETAARGKAAWLSVPFLFAEMVLLYILLGW